MATNYMRYDLMVQDALKGVVREALSRVAKSGLPGEHHLYITFRTDHPEVVISPALKSRYPQEMTIVLQHEFWGLEVGADFFDIGLSFNRVPEHLHIPFAAIRGFFDPSVQFGLEFQIELGKVEPGKAAPGEPKAPLPQKAEAKPAPAGNQAAQIVSLDFFARSRDGLLALLVQALQRLSQGVLFARRQRRHVGQRARTEGPQGEEKTEREHDERPEPQEISLGLEGRLQTHVIAIARHDEGHDRLVAVARLEAFAHQKAQIARERRV